MSALRYTGGYLNPWHDPRNTHSRESFLAVQAPCQYTVCGRGCVVKYLDAEWHYLVNDRLVSMRAGFNMAYLEAAVSVILDGAPIPDHWPDLKIAIEAYKGEE